MTTPRFPLLFLRDGRAKFLVLALPFVLVSSFLPTSLRAQNPAHFALQTQVGSQEELIGIPLRNAALAKGVIQSTDAVGRLTWQSEDLTNVPLPWLKGTGPFYIEFTGPSNHPWIGQRLEIDGVRTQQASDGSIWISSSPRNTRWPLSHSIAGAQAEIRPHVLVPLLFNGFLRNQASAFAASNSATGFPRGAMASAALNFPAGKMSTLFAWLTPAAGLLWGLDPAAGVPAEMDRLVLAPGQATCLRLPQSAFLGMGFSGDEVRSPVAAPIQAGINLLVYPYPAPFKLDPSWSLKHKFLSKKSGGKLADRIVLKKNGTEAHYTLWPALGTGSYGFWRREEPTTRAYVAPAEYLREIEPGQGFYFITSRSYKNHTFDPPQP